MFDLDAVQSALREFEIDAWLLYDFRGSNVLAQRVLQTPPDSVGSRRYFYMVPAEGEPRKLVHRIESGALDHLSGSKTVYLKWGELEAGVGSLVDGCKTVAMEYSPRNANPYISKVDAGTIELVRSFGVDVVPSGDLIQMFEARWTDRQWELHLEAARHVDSSFDRAWRFIAAQVRENGSVDETAVRDEIMRHFVEHGMTTYHPPIVARNAHAGNPHYETGAGDDVAIREGDFVLIDQWAKIDDPDGVYSDVTRTGYVGESVPDNFTEIFNIVAAARDAGIECVRNAFAEDRVLQGWEVDDATRAVIEEAGYGDAFVHRTGHSIGRETHGNGANMDNLETRENRRVMKRTCFSIEPGIYLEDFGVRSETNIYIDAEGGVHVTGGELQTEIVPILAAS